MATNGYVLITHSGQHSGVASYLAGDLGRRGVPAVQRPADHGETQRALHGAAALVVLVGMEHDAGVARGDAERAAHAGKPIYAVRLAPGAGGTLAGLPTRQWADAFGPAAEANVARLAGELHGVMRMAAPPAAPMTQPGYPPARAPAQPPYPPAGPAAQRPYPAAGPTAQPPYPGAGPTAQRPYPPVGPTAHAPYPPAGPTAHAPYPAAGPTAQPPYRPAAPTAQPPYPGAGPTAQAPYPAFAPAAQPPHQTAAPAAQAQHQAATPTAPPQHEAATPTAPPQHEAAPPAQPSQAAAAAPAAQPANHAAATMRPESRPAGPDIGSFEAKRLEPGESVLAWILANQGDSKGIAILTDRRLCFYGKGDAGVRLEAISVQTTQLRYTPDKQPDRLDARFETEEGAIAFSIANELAGAELGNFMGNVKDLRDAQSALRDAGYDRATAQEETPGPEYRLMRLRELLNQGALSESEYEAQRALLITKVCGWR